MNDNALETTFDEEEDLLSLLVRPGQLKSDSVIRYVKCDVCKQEIDRFCDTVCFTVVGVMCKDCYN